MNRETWVDLWSDMRHALRSLRGAPLFVVIVVATLSIGIGVNTTMFSIVDAVLIRPLPYDDPEQLVLIGNRTPDDGASTYGLRSDEYFAILDSTDAFAAIGAYDYGGGTLSGDGLPPEEPTSLSVSVGFAEALGLRPILGRVFTEEECSDGGPPVAILGEQIWNRRYNGDPSIIGKPILLEGTPHEVVGILSDAFRFPEEEAAIQLFRPRSMNRARVWRSLGLVARMNPGVDAAQADSQLAVVATTLQAEKPETNEDREFFVRLLHDEAVGEVQSSLLLLWAAVGFVLVLACMNTANLMLSRGMTKINDLAVLSAIGASRGRIVQRLLTESVVLGLFSGLLGLLIAQIGLETIAALGMTDLPRADMIAIDPRAFLFTFALGVATGILCGMLPAWRLTRVELSQMVKEGGESRGSAGPASQRTRAILTAGEVAIACVLLIGAGLLVRSSLAVRSTDPGFDHRNVLGMTMWADKPRGEEDSWTQRFYEDVLDNIRQIPGVESAGLVTWMPWRTIFDESTNMFIDGHPMLPAGEPTRTRIRIVSEDYFETMRMAMISGRTFESTDTPETHPVTVISRSIADRYWPEGDAVGQFVQLSSEKTSVLIIGVVADIRERGIDVEPEPAVYASFRQFPRINASIMVRTEGDPALITQPAQAAVWDVLPSQGIWRTTTLETMLQTQLARETLYMKLLAIFAGVAVLLAAAGIYGVISFSVSQRTREIGIRMALGAGYPEIRRGIVGRGLRLSAIGLAVGLPGSYAVGRLLGNLLYGVGPLDPATYVAVVALVAVVTTGACLVPAVRATRVQPSVSLRAE